MFLGFMAIFGIVLFFLSIYATLQTDKTDDISYNKTKKHSYSKPAKSPTPNSDNQYFINGQPVKTNREFRQWGIVKGVGTSIECHVEQLARELSDYRNLDAYSSFKHWRNRYEKYRNYCIQHSLWNWLIGDRTPFIPTEYQLRLEQDYIRSVEREYYQSQQKRAAYRDELEQINIIKSKIIEYIGCQYGKRAIRHAMIDDIAKETDIPKNIVQKAYRRLLKDGVIGEKKNDNNRYVVRIIHRRKKPDPPPVDTTPSPKRYVYRMGLYRNIDTYMFDKARYSVSIPHDVDRIKNTCTFKSMADETKYFTTLESCTCPAAEREIPCKHMVALAVYLGYLKEDTKK